MINVIALKDIRLLRRESLMVIVTVVCGLLLLLSALAGMQREAVFAKERASAEQIDRKVWMNQGERNPHSAAHFSRYAFRPPATLALIDPGISDFSGLAVWMEAHFQDPAEFRRAEDSGALSRFVQLTPANLLLIAMPLLVFLAMYAAIAGEREDGTLKQLIASGVDGFQLFAGKLWAGLRLALTLFAALFLPLLLFTLWVTPGNLVPDILFRATALFGVYFIYLICWVTLALGVSALFRTRQSAFLAMVCLWAVMAVLVPRLAADLGARLHPEAGARAISAQLDSASSIFWNDEALQKETEASALEAYGVSSVEELPFEYSAYRLQASEELAIPEFERIYSELARSHQAQNSVARMFSLITPTIAAVNLSRGIAGTDSLHQNAFTKEAEMHRRAMVKLLNDDYQNNAEGKGSSYKAGAELWQQFSDFKAEPVAFKTTLSAYGMDLLFLLLWTFAALAIAYALVLRAVKQELAS